MDKNLLFNLGLNTDSFKKSWNEVINLIKNSDNVFKAIEKMADNFKSQAIEVNNLEKANTNLTNSQNKIISSNNNLISSQNNIVIGLKSQNIEKEKLNINNAKELQIIDKTIEAQRNLNKERQAEANALKLKNKENSLDIKDLTFKNKDDRKELRGLDPKKDISQIAGIKSDIKERNDDIEVLKRLILQNSKVIKSIEDKIHVTNQDIQVQKELLGIEKIKTIETQNSIKDKTNLIKSIELENQVLKEQEGIKKQLERNQIKLTNNVTKTSSSDLKEETTRLLNNQKKALDEKNKAEKEQLELTKNITKNSSSDLKEETTRLINNQKKAIEDKNRALREQEQIEKNVLLVEQQAIKQIKDSIDVSKAKILGIDAEISKQRERLSLGSSLTNAQTNYNNQIKSSIATATQEKNLIIDKIAKDTQHIRILEGKATAQNFDTTSMQDNLNVIKNMQNVLPNLIQQEKEQKKAIEDKKQAEIDEIKIIQAKILKASDLAKSIKDEIKLTNDKKFSLKNITEDQKKFNDNIDKTVNVLKQEKQVLTDNIRLLSNKKDNIKNSNVELLNSNNLLSKNISELERQKALINSVPKNNAGDGKNDLSFFDRMINRIASYTIGSLLSTAITDTIQQIKTFAQEASKEFLTLERNISLIQGLVIDLNVSFGKINETIQEAGNKTGTLFSSASEGVRTIIAGGIEDLTEATSVYTSSVSLAKLSTSKYRTEQQNLNDVVNSAILILNNYNLKAKDLPTLYNQIAVAASKSKLDVADFAKYLGGQSAEFSSFRGSFADMISLFSVFSNNLRSGSEADTALRAFVKKIQSPTSEMKKFSEEAKKLGLDIEFSPSAIQKKGFNQYFKDLFSSLEKFSFPEDIIKDLFNLANASKGFRSLAQSFKDVKENGKSAFEDLRDSVVSNTDLMQKQYDFLLSSLSEKLNITKVSFVNFFIKSFVDARFVLADLLDKGVIGLNIVMGLFKQFIGLFTPEDFDTNAFLTYFRTIGFGIELVIKSLRFFIDFWGVAFSLITSGFGGLYAIIADFGQRFYSLLFGNAAEKKKALQGIGTFITDVVKSIDDKMKEKEKSLKQSFKNIFDLDKYVSVNPPDIVKSKLDNNVEKAQNKDYRANILLTGTSEIDNNSRALSKVNDEIEKTSKSMKGLKFDIERKEVSDKFLEDAKKAREELAKIKDIAPKQIEELQGDLLNPDKNEAEKKQIQGNIEKLQKALYNSQLNFDNLMIGLEKRKNLELRKINEEEQKKKEQDHKKDVDEKFKAIIDKQKEKINDVEIDNDGLPKIEIIKKKNAEMKVLAQNYRQWGAEFKKGSSDRAEHEKQASEQEKQITRNNANIQKDILKERLETSKLNYEKRLEQLRMFNLDVKLSEDKQLNDEAALNKTRVKELKAQITTEKLSLDQQKSIKENIAKLETSIDENIIKIRDIRRQREHDKRQETIEQTKDYYSLLTKLGLKSEQDQLNNIIESNNKQILELKKKNRETQNIDEIRKNKKEIRALKSNNLSTINDINDIGTKERERQNEKIFNDEIKRINFLKELNILSEKQTLKEQVTANEDYTKALLNQEKELTDKFGVDPKNNEKKKELEDLQAKIKDIFRTIQTDSKKINDIIKAEDKEIFDRKISYLMSYSEGLKTIGETISKNNFDSIGNIFKETGSSSSNILQNFQKFNSYKEDFKNAGNNEDKAKIFDKLDADFIKTSIDVTIGSINKLIDITPKAFSQIDKLSTIYQKYGKDSIQAGEATKEVTELISEQMQIIPVFGGLLSSLSRGITDLFGLTKSEGQKKKDEELIKADYELQLTKVRIQKESTQQKLDISNIEYEENKRVLAKTFTDQDTFNKNMEKLEIEHQNNNFNIVQEGKIKLLEIENNYKNAMYGIQKDSYSNQRKNAYDEYLIEFEKLKQKGSTLKEYETIKQNYYNKVEVLDRQNAKTNYDIENELQKSILNLKEESETKSIQLAELERDNKLRILDEEFSKDTTKLKEYNKQKQTIENEFLASKLKIQNDNTEKIRALNDKNYNEELKAFNSLYSKETDKVKSELQKRYDIIADYQNKIDELNNKRQEDQELKTKRDKQYNIDLAIKAKALINNGAFNASNQLDFEIGNGSTSGNETLRKKADKDFEAGKITYQQLLFQHQQLALEKQLYYEKELTKYRDPADRQKLEDKITEARKEYYNYIFDKEKEAIDLENAKAKREIAALETQYKNRMSIEDKFIKELDDKYKTAAGLYKESFVNATRDWIKFAKDEGMLKLGLQTFETINQVGNNINKNAIESKKITPDTSISSINNANIDTGYKPSTANPFIPKTANLNANSGVDLGLNDSVRQKILDNIYQKLGASKREEALRLSTADLIKYAQMADIPMFASGGVPNKAKFLINESQNAETVYNWQQAKNNYDFVVEATKNGGSGVKGSPIYNIYIGETKISGNMSNLSEMRALIKESNQELMTKIKDKKIGIQ